MAELRRRELSSASALLGREVTFVEELAGGQHATTLLAKDGAEELVVRTFPAHDGAVVREAEILTRLSGLGAGVPHLVAAGADDDEPIIITSRVPGSVPAADLSPLLMAAEMAAALVRIHELDGSGLPPIPAKAPMGDSAIARRAQREFEHLDRDDPVLVHRDFWCGNALWEGERLTGVVDWSGAGCGPRGVDIAWCRQDLVLLGSPAAAQVFLQEYERLLGRPIGDITAWDVQAAARAHDRVETWLPNYLGIGRTDMTAELLRERLDEWNAHL